MVGVGGFGLRRGGAAVGGLAADDLELDGGVGDVEAVAQGELMASRMEAEPETGISAMVTWLASA